jgi:hypothetical protein
MAIFEVKAEHFRTFEQNIIPYDIAELATGKVAVYKSAFRKIHSGEARVRKITAHEPALVVVTQL